MIMYNIPYYQSTTDFLVHIAKQRGRIRKVYIFSNFYIKL